MVRKILGWLIVVLIAVFIGFIIWLFFFREEPTPSGFRPPERPDDFFPVDPTRSGDDIITNNADNDANNNGRRNLIPRLRQLSDVPTAGGVAFERSTNSSETLVTEDGIEETVTGSITIFRYIERATGHLYEGQENSLTQTRLSNTTIPKVYQAKFAPDGQHALLQMIDEDGETVETLAATVTPKSTTSPETFRLVADGYSLEGSFLSPNTSSADITQHGLTYIVPNSDGGSSLITSDFNDLTKNLIFESPLQEWLVQRASGNRIALTTKADSREEGFSYLINTGSGDDTKILSDISGLTTLISPSEKWILYSLSRENELDFFALNQESGEVIKVGLETLPEKCVFANTDEDTVFCAAPTQAERVPYPESWYQGLVSFEDNLWKVDLETEEYIQILGDREDVLESFDISKLTLSPKDEFLLFINRKDLSLWSLDVTVIER